MKTPWIIGTGFSRGIGLELAKKIKDEGYSIFHIGRKLCGFEDEFLHWDLSVSPTIEFFQSLHSALLNKKICGFFYSAGLFPALLHETNQQKADFWESQTRTMQVNYLSCAVLVEEILPHILNSKKNDKSTEKIPFIAHFSSLAAVDPLPALEFYGISKAAILKYFEDFSKRFSSKELNFFSIHPGTVQTDMIESILIPEEHKHLPVIQIFENALTEKKLLSAKQSAELVSEFLFEKSFEELRTVSNGKLYLADTKKIFS